MNATAVFNVFNHCISFPQLVQNYSIKTDPGLTIIISFSLLSNDINSYDGLPPRLSEQFPNICYFLQPMVGGMA